MGQTYYEILGVAENATAAEIEAAFKAKAREVHPDTVPAENAYMRKVAAEAFKDLSEAKAALINPTARQKYDAELASSRAAKQTPPDPRPESSVGANAPPRDSSRTRSSSRFRKGASSANAGGARRPRPVPHLPEIKNLNGFLFILLGMATIFFLAALVWSGRMPPIWLATITAGLGILSFVNGMRPISSPITSGRTPLLVTAGLIAIVLLALLLLSPSYFDLAASRVAGSSPSPSNAMKNAQPGAAAGHATPGPTIAVVDESGEDAALPTKMWTNLKDGQVYRTRLNGELLSLEAIASGGKSTGEITKCEFHRAGGGAASWLGICTEQNLQGDRERDSMATLSQFSDTRLEGSTKDIPVFVMTPVDTVPMGANPLTSPEAVPQVAPQGAPQIAPQVGPPAEGEAIAEPDLSGLKSADRDAIQANCASDKLNGGTDKYNECLRRQVEDLKRSPRPRGFSKLSSADRDAVEFACTTAKLTQGPGAYNQCLATQMNVLKKRKQ
jgi:DnaJ domain